MGCRQVFEARQVAETALARVRPQGDKVAEATILVAVAQTLADGQDGMEQALSAVQEGLQLCSQITLRSAAKVHLQASKLFCQVGRLDETLAHAQDALASFRHMRDWLGERSAKAVLSEVYSRRGEPQLAPNRPEAVKLVTDMANAVQLRHADLYQTAAEHYATLAVANPPVSTAEHREIFKDIVKRDAGSIDFIHANGGQTSLATGKTFSYAEKTMFYATYRASGIAYGPRYRAVDAALGLATAPEGYDDEAHAYAVYQLQEDADDWEKHLRAHPSLLDAALQSSTVIGMAQRG
mmetsp:Transcript_12727/g.30291  ORF Transcript_12727/g.30291 Transcript_12727/m.30291 type:complete len:295 (+) Transcript_12727:1219-2103(+)